MEKHFSILTQKMKGYYFIGCAGGMDTIGTMKYNLIPDQQRFSSSLKYQLRVFMVVIQADEIHKGYANALKIMNRLLWKSQISLRFILADFNGGNFRNAIPREAFSTIVVNKGETGSDKKLD